MLCLLLLLLALPLLVDFLRESVGSAAKLACMEACVCVCVCVSACVCLSVSACAFANARNHGHVRIRRLDECLLELKMAAQAFAL